MGPMIPSFTEGSYGGAVNSIRLSVRERVLLSVGRSAGGCGRRRFVLNGAVAGWHMFFFSYNRSYDSGGRNADPGYASYGAKKKLGEIQTSAVNWFGTSG